jgi:hypothetical protein
VLPALWTEGVKKILTINQEPNLSGTHQNFFPARSRHLRASLGEMLSGPLKKDQRLLNFHRAVLAGNMTERVLHVLLPSPSFSTKLC